MGGTDEVEMGCGRMRRIKCLVICVSRFPILRCAFLISRTEEFLPDATTMPWANWLNTAWVNKLYIDNWPSGLDAPGGGFRFKKLTLPDLIKIVEGYEVDGVRYHVKIARWNIGTCIHVAKVWLYH